jgi:CheY-like chemotaxis protein
MTNDAIVSLFDHLCNEARNAMHATFGLMEFRPERATGRTWQTCLDASRSSADRLLRTIDDTRELVSGKPPGEGASEKIDFALCVAETAALLNLAARDSGAKLGIECFDEPLRIRQNRPALEQLLARILKLVLTLAREGEVHTSVSADGKDRLRLDIVPPEADVARQLAEWLNADPDQQEFDEARIGPMVAALVAGRRLRALGGSAELTSRCGTGIGLAIFLPREAVGLEEQPLSFPAAGTEPLQVLVAEDCDESYALTELLLPNECVDRARDGVEAIAKVKQRRFDVVLMDIHMPGINGYESISAIRDWETISGQARTPMVVLSADDIATQTRCAAQAGCSGFLRKPVRSSDLVDLLETLRATRDRIV